MKKEWLTKSRKTIITRLVCSGDNEHFLTFYGGLSGESRSRFNPHLFIEEVIARRIERCELGLDRCYLAFFGKDAIGYFFLWNYNERVPILGIGIVDAFQGEGLGRKFVNLLIEDARTNGNDGVELTTMPDNHSAFALYEKCGFKYYKDVENIAGDGRTEIERAMFLPLKPDVLPLSKPHRTPD